MLSKIIRTLNRRRESGGYQKVSAFGIRVSF